MTDGQQAPNIRVPVTGPESRRLASRLAELENPAIARRRERREVGSGREQTPVVWNRARGVNVWDVDGNRLVDLTAGFGVAAIGHAHPRVVEAGREQLAMLPHAMGDAYPAASKARLLDELHTRLPGNPVGITLGCSGSDAIDAALKTAVLATRRSSFLSFRPGYHGLGLGALRVSGYRQAFREPFSDLLGDGDPKLPWPVNGDGAEELASVERALAEAEAAGRAVAAVVTEPILGRGGNHVPPEGFLRGLAERAHAAGALLIVDEIFTGWGRSGSTDVAGAWFAISEEIPAPDIVCVGKAMSGGYPISACAASPDIAAAWGESEGEAIHTQTFLGNPVGCAMALACIEVLEIEALPERCAEVGRWFLGRLNELHTADPERFGPARGRGLMLALEIRESGIPSASTAIGLSRALLERGWIALPCGLSGDALQFTPPFTISRELLDMALSALVDARAELP